MARKIKKTVSHLRATKPVNLTERPFTPPPYRLALGIVLGIQSLLIIWALTHHFIPSPSWRGIIFYINIVFCTLCLAFFVNAFRLNAHLYTSKLKKLTLVIFAPLLIYCWGYLALNYGAGDLITHLSGKPSKMEDVLTKYADDDERFKKEYITNGVYEKRYFDNRKGCITRLTSFILKDALPVYFCVSGEDYAVLPNEVAVNIHGLKSYSGFDIERIEYDWLKTSLLPIEDSP